MAARGTHQIGLVGALSSIPVPRMLHRVGRIHGDERGLTLVELAIVIALLAILAGVTAMSIRGGTTAGRSTALSSDRAQVQRAVQRYAGQHRQGQYPTINGCLPGERKTARGVCQAVATGSTGELAPLDRATWEAIIWDKGMRATSTEVLIFGEDLLATLPRHATEHRDGSSWSLTTPDPDGVVDEPLLVPDDTGFQDTTPASERMPVWLLDRSGRVHVAIAPSDY